MRMYVYLDTEEKVQAFANAASKFDGDIDVMYKHYILDAKSVLGLMSIPRNEKLAVRVHDILDTRPESVDPYLEAFREFLA